jgi:hypothetical protein
MNEEYQEGTDRMMLGPQREEIGLRYAASTAPWPTIISMLEL